MARQKDPLDLLVDAIFDRLFDAEGTGRFGEGLTAGQLKRLSCRLGEGKVLRNVYVPKEGGGTSEIDVLFITSRGVFVIESKNYSGWIFGREEDRYWTQCLQSGQKNRFYNPVLQNRGHLKWLRRTLGEDVPLYSLVVFSERCELKKVTLTSEDVVVVKREDLGGAVRRIWDAAEGAGPVDVGEAFRRLEPFAHADAQTKAEHVEEAQAAARRAGRRAGLEKEMAMGAAATATSAPAPALAGATAEADAAGEHGSARDSHVCPRCGKPLVVRTARRGPNAGNRFYGCSGFPGCHYTQAIPPEEDVE